MYAQEPSAEHKPACPYQNLACAVLLKAFEDALSEPGSFVSEVEIKRARNWLTRPNSQFYLICEIANMPPSGIMRRAKMLIKIYDLQKQEEAAMIEK